jgi:hypothetical protein
MGFGDRGLTARTAQAQQRACRWVTRVVDV